MPTIEINDDAYEILMQTLKVVSERTSDSPKKILSRIIMGDILKMTLIDLMLKTDTGGNKKLKEALNAVFYLTDNQLLKGIRDIHKLREIKKTIDTLSKRASQPYPGNDTVN